MGTVLSFLPTWSYWLIAAVILAGTMPYWTPIWLALPKPVKYAILAAGGIFTAWHAGRRQQRIADEQKQKDARAEEQATGEHLRPIMLIKAERRDKDRETLTVEVVEKALIEQCKVPADWIVRATGDDRGLDGVDLFAADCPVRFVITVDALKEGWDCSWAYVLCSVAEMRSDTAIEQIIGRVLRLPDARRKQTPALNRAYAFATSTNFAQTARALEDALVEGNGFNPLEVKDLVVTPAGEQGKLELPATSAVPPKTVFIQSVLP